MIALLVFDHIDFSYDWSIVAETIEETKAVIATHPDTNIFIFEVKYNSDDHLNLIKWLDEMNFKTLSLITAI